MLHHQVLKGPKVKKTHKLHTYVFDQKRQFLSVFLALAHSKLIVDHKTPDSRLWGSSKKESHPLRPSTYFVSIHLQIIMNN